MAVNPIIECFGKDLLIQYCHGLESSAVYTAPLFFVETFTGHSNRTLPCLSLHIHAQASIPTFLTWNIYIGLCLHKALTLTGHWLDEVLEILAIVRMNKHVGLAGIHNYCLLRDALPYCLARGIPLKGGVP